MERANDLFHNHSLTLITPSTAKKYLCTYVSLGEEFNRGRCDDAAVHGGLGDFALLGDWITYPFDFSLSSCRQQHSQGSRQRNQEETSHALRFSERHGPQVLAQSESKGLTVGHVGCFLCHSNIN